MKVGHINSDIRFSKSELIDKLKKRNLFWSYDPESITDISDSATIQTTMLYGDMDELSSLLSLYSLPKLKEEWSHLFKDSSPYKREAIFVANYLFGGEQEI